MGKSVKDQAKTGRNDERSREVKDSRRFNNILPPAPTNHRQQHHGQEYPDQFKYDYAVSRGDKNAAGQKMCLPHFKECVSELKFGWFEGCAEAQGRCTVANNTGQISQLEYAEKDVSNWSRYM